MAKQITRTELVLSGENKGELLEIVPMPIEQVKRLQYGERVKAYTSYYGRDEIGGLVNVKINGKPKTWKTRPDDVDVPIKYGLYEYATISYRDGAMIDGGLWFVTVVGP